MVDIENELNFCGLVTFYIADSDQNKVANYLFGKYKIFTASMIHEEFEGVRIAPNVYTKVEEIIKFADVLESILKNIPREILK